MTADPSLALIMSTLRGSQRTGHKAAVWLHTYSARLGCVPASLCGTAGGRARVLAEVAAMTGTEARDV